MWQRELVRLRSAATPRYDSANKVVHHLTDVSLVHVAYLVLPIRFVREPPRHAVLLDSTLVGRLVQDGAVVRFAHAPLFVVAHVVGSIFGVFPSEDVGFFPVGS